MISIAKKTGKLPKALKDKPVLDDPFLKEVSKGFFFLSAGRGMGSIYPNPIPISEMLLYCSLVGISNQDDLEEFVWFIREMDLTFLNWYKETYQDK